MKIRSNGFVLEMSQGELRIFVNICRTLKDLHDAGVVDITREDMRDFIDNIEDLYNKI